MYFTPQFLTFQEADTFDTVQLNIVRADTGESIVGAFLGVPPFVDGKYKLDVQGAGNPSTNPELAGVEVKAKISVKLGTLSSGSAFSEPFVFVEHLSDPFDLTLV